MTGPPLHNCRIANKNPCRQDYFTGRGEVRDIIEQIKIIPFFYKTITLFG